MRKAGHGCQRHGRFAEKAKVDDAFLTDHRFDLKVKVLEQTPTSLKFRIPPFIKPGRHQLLLQTSGDSPKLLEQPVYVTIDIDDVQVADKDKKYPADKEKGTRHREGRRELGKQP